MNFELLFIHLLPVVVLVFFVRALFRIRYRKATGSDVWFHLHAAEEIRNNRQRIPETLGGFLIETPFDYPPLVHFILSLISRQRREDLEPFFGPIVDTIQAVVLFLFTQYLSGSFEIAFVSGVLFAFFPLLVKADARVYFLSPRPAGELFASLAMVFSLLFVWFGDILSVVLAVLFLSFVFLSSKFGAQAVILIYVMMAFFLLNPYFLPILLGGFILAIIISLGHYLKVVSGHIRHSRFYRSTIVHKHSWTKQISQKTETPLIEEEVEPKVLAVALLKNPVIFALSHAPLILILALIGILNYSALVGNAISLSLLAWSVAPFILVIVISFRALRFLGEAERYLEYGAIPLCALVPIILFEMNNTGLWILLFFVFLYSAVLIWINYGVSFKEFVIRPGDPEDLVGLLHRLNEIPNGRILCIPITTSFAISYGTHHKTLFWGGNVPSEHFSSEDFDFIFKDEFPFPSEDLDSLISRCGITHIVVWKQSLDRAPDGYYRRLSEYPVLFENESFVIHGSAL